MPKSKRAIEEKVIKPTGQSSDSTQGKKKRKTRQRKRELYQKVREDLQVSGDLPVTPEGALKSERVDPATQEDTPQPKLIQRAIRQGWAVLEEKKPNLVDELTKIIDNPDMPAKMKIAAFNALQQADRSQWERDNPIEAGRAKGGNVSVSVEANKIAIQVLRGMFEDELGAGQTALPAPIESLPLSHSRFDGEVETGATSTEDQYRTS